MSNFFGPGEAADDAYVFNRDDDNRQDVREYLQRIWEQYEPYNGDPHFLSAARSEFHARTWEMILAGLLLDYGYVLQRPPSNGPDIKVLLESGRTMWIEATSVELGTGQNSSARVITQTMGNSALFQTQPDKTALRYTGALFNKQKQLQDFIQREIVREEDLFVVAINGGLLHDYSSADHDPEILKSVYPIGDAFFSYSVGGDGDSDVESGNYYRECIEREDGTQIPTTAFLAPLFSGISGLLYSRTTAWNPHSRVAEHVTFIPNISARNKMPSRAFQFGRAASIALTIGWEEHPDSR